MSEVLIVTSYAPKAIKEKEIHFFFHFCPLVNIKALQALRHAPPLHLNQASARTLSK